MLKLLHPSAQKSKLFIVTMNDQTLKHRLCSVDGCGQKHRAHGYCKNHYKTHSYYRNPVSYFQRLFKNRLYYRIPGVYERALARSRKPEQIKKHRVRAALRKGVLKKKPCEVCGSTGRIHAHHDSYLPDKWLSVRFLCTKHHGEWHRVNKPVYPESL